MPSFSSLGIPFLVVHLVIPPPEGETAPCRLRQRRVRLFDLLYFHSLPPSFCPSRTFSPRHSHRVPARRLHARPSSHLPERRPGCPLLLSLTRAYRPRGVIFPLRNLICDRNFHLPAEVFLRRQSRVRPSRNSLLATRKLAIMAQTQPREGSLNPSSPHSSVGGADSYKHDGTPDTRLTAFSPEENSAKSAKLIKAITSSPSDGGQAIYPAQQPPVSAPFRNGPAQLERDPFVSTNTPVRKQEQKLSATASAFRPFAAPLVAQGSADSTAGTASKTPSRTTPQHVLPVSPILSTDLHYSRCLVVSSSTHPVTLAGVELLLSVSASGMAAASSRSPT